MATSIAAIGRSVSQTMTTENAFDLVAMGREAAPIDAAIHDAVALPPDEWRDRQRSMTHGQSYWCQCQGAIRIHR
jgi:hypothetical protein